MQKCPYQCPRGHQTALTVPAWPPLNLPMVQDPPVQPGLGLSVPHHGLTRPWGWGGRWLPRGEPSSNVVGGNELIKDLQLASKSPWRALPSGVQPRGAAPWDGRGGLSAGPAGWMWSLIAAPHPLI